MKKVFFLLFICLVSATDVWSQKDKDKDSNDDDHGRENWFPERGNVGIGVGRRNTASQKLEVMGNVKVSGTIFTNRLETIGLKASDFMLTQDATIGRNLLIQGNVGINIASPVERLEVGGNLKVTNALFADQGVFNSNFKVGPKFTIDGLSGDIAATNGVFGGNILSNQNLTVNGMLGVGVSPASEKLDVGGNIKASGNLLSAGLQTGNAQLTSLSVGQNSIFSGLVGIGVATPVEKLHVGGNLKVDGGILSQSFNSTNLTAGQFTSGMASFTDNISVAKDALVTGKIGIGTVTPSESLDVNGNIKLSGAVTGNSINVNTATVNQNLNVAGNSILSGNLQVNGTFSASNLAINDVSTNGNTVVGQNLTVNGASQLTGDLTVGGNMTAGVITASEFRTTGGSSAFNFTNATISQTLAVATAQPIPANYKLAVGGSIIATGIDVKIPSKWPDYVFESDYDLMNFDELNHYVKEHGHLPSLPSAQEMKAKKVYSLSEMDTKLLEKVEELTLYILQLEKRIQELEKDKSK